MHNLKSLVLVVGAGASKEVNFPIGEELKRKIASAFDFKQNDAFRISGGDPIILEALRSHRDQETRDKLMRAATLVRNGMSQAPSIDNFIHVHRDRPEVAFCGKLAIAQCILSAESNSVLKIDASNTYNKMKFSQLEDTWYNKFFQSFFGQHSFKALPAQLAKLTVITFNYDRCIEHYLFHSFMNYYDISPEEAKELMIQIRIYHPYGSLGDLPWKGTPRSIQFGEQINSQKLIAVTDNLQTFTEGTDEEHSEIMAIRTAIHTAGKIAFLGFAFNEQNLDLLFNSKIEARPLRGVPIYGTAFGLSTSDVTAITNEIATTGRIDRDYIHLEREYKCARLISDYSRALKV